MSDPVVGIVMPVKDEAPFIAEAIESVLRQTFESWCLVIVDNGSSDGSLLIAGEYEARHPSKILTMRRLEGMGAVPRSLGAKLLDTEYLAFLDADDVWCDELKLSDQIAVMHCFPEIAMTYGPAIDDEIGVQDVMFPGEIASPPELFNLYQRYPGAAPSPSGILVRKKAFDVVGGFEMDPDCIYDDQAFYTKICVNYPVYVSKLQLYRYRRHERQVTAKAHRDGKTEEMKAAYKAWLKGYLWAIGKADLWFEF